MKYENPLYENNNKNLMEFLIRDDKSYYKSPEVRVLTAKKDGHSKPLNSSKTKK